MGGLHCRNNILFTPYYVPSTTYLHNASVHQQRLKWFLKLLFMRQFTAFVNEWTSCKYHGHANTASGPIHPFWSHQGCHQEHRRLSQADFNRQTSLPGMLLLIRVYTSITVWQELCTRLFNMAMKVYDFSFHKNLLHLH